MTPAEIKADLDALPGALALFWYMENVDDEHPHRTELFFYCRERARRYGTNWHAELKFDKLMFERIERS
jgi:hypothetical protein